MRIDIDGMDIETETDDFGIPDFIPEQSNECLVRNIQGTGKILEMLIKQRDNDATIIALAQLRATIDLAVLGVVHHADNT